MILSTSFWIVLFIDKIEQYKYTISIYPKLWNHPLQYTLNTKKNTVFTDVPEDIHQHLIGKFHAIEDGVEVCQYQKKQSYVKKDLRQ